MAILEARLTSGYQRRLFKLAELKDGPKQEPEAKAADERRTGQGELKRESEAA